MNKKIFENVRFTPKGDIEANWNKAVGFVPLKKEIIEYLPDENNAAARFKVGDGVTSVQDLPFSGTDLEAVKKLIDEKISQNSKKVQPDWNQHDPVAADYIKNRPFYDEVIDGTPSVTYTFDGILEGKEVITAPEDDSFYLVKVSDDILNYEQLLGGTVTYADSITFEPIGDYTMSESDIISADDGIAWGIIGDMIFVISNGQLFAEEMGVTPPSQGTYFVYVVEDGYVSQLTTTSLTTVLQPIKKIDEKFLPDFINNSFDMKLDKTGGAIGGDLTILGNLEVLGTTVTKDTETLLVKDNVIVANSDGVELYDLSGFAIRTNANDAYGIMYDKTGDGVKIGLGQIQSAGRFTYSVDEAQFLATRDDSIADGNLVCWNDEKKKLVDSGVATDVVATVQYVNVKGRVATIDDILKLFNSEVL